MKIKHEETKKPNKSFKIYNIFSILIVFSAYLKFTGIATIYKAKSKSGNIVYNPEKFNFINVSFLVVGISVTAYFLNETFNDVYMERIRITKVLYLLTCVSYIATVITTSMNSTLLLETMNKIDRIDNILKMPSYNKWIIICSIALCSNTIIVVVFYTIKFLEENAMRLITEYFSYAHSLIILTIILIIFNIFVMIIRERFQKINYLLKNYDSDISFFAKEKNYMSSKEIKNHQDFLNLMTDLHYELCECATKINDIYTVCLFFCVHIVYGEIIYAAYALKYPFESITHDVHFLLFAFIMTLQLISVLICTYLTENEAKTTFLLLGDMTICYYDDNLALTKNSLLLQGLHHKIEFNMMHIYPLTLGVLAEELSTLTTIILFLID